MALTRRHFPWLWTVFHRLIYDQAEGVEKRRKIWDHVKERLRGTRVGEAVAGLDPARRSALFARIREIVETLSPRQKLVVETFLEGYPLTEDPAELRRRISEKSGEELSPRAVMCAMWRARGRVKELLTREREGEAGGPHEGPGGRRSGGAGRVAGARVPGIGPLATADRGDGLRGGGT